jgi:uncharacterized protein (TIGR03067 family)
MSTFLLALAVWTAANPAREPAKPAPKIDGKWVLAAGHANGQDLPAAARGHVRLIVVADEMILCADGGRSSRFVVRLDATTDPARIDLNGIDGRDTGKNLLGIFELKDDRLKVCRTLNAKVERPKEFLAAAGSKCVVEEWRREKDEYSVAEDRLRLTGRWRVADKAAGAQGGLRDLGFADPLLSATSEGGQQLGLVTGPWRIEEANGVRTIVGPAGACTYKFDDGRLRVEFADGRFNGAWTLTKVRTP